MNQSPARILYTSDSIELPVKKTDAASVDTRGIVSVGIDDADGLHFIKTDITGNQKVTGVGSAGVPDTGIITVQGISNGTTIATTLSNALPAGTNNIGDVDVLTVPAPLNVVGGGAEATALRVTLANDSTGVLSVNNNGTFAVQAAQIGTWLVNGSGFTQPISGTVDITDNNGSITVDAITLPLPTGASTLVDQQIHTTLLTSIEQILDKSSKKTTKVQKRYDLTDAITNYIATAPLGSLSSDSDWIIKKITFDIDENPVLIQWSADSVKWDDRASLSYS